MSWKKNLAIVTALAGATALGIHAINKFIYFSATLDNLLNNPSGTYYEWRFGKIYYTKHGEGKPVLLIHDLTTYSSACEWSKVVHDLAKTNTVYAIDLLGCGRSDKPNFTYTNYLYVQMISDFIKHVIGDKTDVVVTGESASFILGACQNDTSIIDKIVMVNPTDIGLSSKAPGARSKMITKLINLPLIGTLLYNILTTRRDINASFHTDYYYTPENVDDGIVGTYYEAAHSGGASSKYLLASLAGYYMTSNIPLYLESLNNSIFIIVGEGTSENEIFAKEYQHILPSIEIIEMEETKHLPQLEKPEEFVSQISILLDTGAEEDTQDDYEIEE